MEAIINTTKTMSSREIAELTGKPHNDVLKAIRAMESAWLKITKGNFSLSEYTDSTGRKQPMYELTKKECLYVATKFNDEARARLVLRWEELEVKQEIVQPQSQIDILVQSVLLLKEQEQRVAKVEEKVKELEAKTQTRPNYFTVVGYGTLNGINVNLSLASRLGRKASMLCKLRNIQTDEIPDPRFGRVKLYPKQVLEEVFAEPL